MKLNKTIAALAMFLIIAGNLQAQTVPANQRHRIREGVRSGELTRNEARQLHSQEKDIRKDKKEARADGVVTPAERKEIRKDERSTNRNIYRKKHNGRVR